MANSPGASADHRKKRRSRCLWSATAAVIAIGLLFLILGLTVFKAKRPVTTVNSVSVSDLDFSVDVARLRVKLNISIDTGVTVKNPNRVGFKYSDSNAFLRYRGNDVGQVPLPAGEIGARDTRNLNLTLTLMADRLLSDSNFYSDVVSGVLHLQTIIRISGTKDGWLWSNHGSGKFTSSSAYSAIYSMLTDHSQQMVGKESFKFLWKAHAIHRAKTTAWRGIINRMPTGDNLLKRNCIALTQSRCILCNDQVESAAHTLLHCQASHDIWKEIGNWSGVQLTFPFNVAEHFLSFSFSGNVKNHRVLGGLWICTVWVIWKWRNNIIFEHIEWNAKLVVNEIKSHFWSWCKFSDCKMPRISFRDWCFNSLFETFA